MAFNDWLLRLTANFDLKYRFQTAKTFMKANPQLAEESKHDYMRRVHWAVLQTYGLPPLSIVNFWLSSNKPYILAPTDQIERYLIAFHDCVASEVTALDARKYVLQLDDQTIYPDRYAGPDLVLRHYVNPVRHKFWTTS